MKRNLAFIIITLLLTLNLFGAQQFIENYSSNQTCNFTFKTPEFKIVPEGNYRKITFPKLNLETEMTKEGEPAIPTFSKLLIVPEGKEPVITIKQSSKKIRSNVNIIPSRKLIDPINKAEIKSDASIYNSFKNKPIASVTEIGLMRNYTVARIEVAPFRFNSKNKNLEILDDIEIEINFVDSANNLRTTNHKVSRDFEKLMKSLVINPSAIETRTTYQRGSYLIIHPQNTIISEILEEFASWKRQKGYYVKLVDLSETGSTTNTIKSYIQNEYDTSEFPPEYILIAGDGNHNFTVPTYFETYGFGQSVHGDHHYVELAGDDTFSDAFIGRFSYNELSTLQTIVNKIVRYEKMTLSDTYDWLDRYLLYADYTQSGVSTVYTMNFIENIISDHNNEAEFKRVFEAPFISQLAAHLNAGAGAFFYRGFGDFSGWTSTDTNNLYNTNLTPFATIITCHTGGFATDNSPCLIEQFTRLGTPNNLKGTLAAIGSSSATHTCFNNLLTASIAQSIYQLGFDNLGMAHSYAKVALYNSYPSNPFEYVDWYTIGKNLLGDPGMTVSTKRPELMIADYANNISLGTNSIQFSILDEDENPIEEALISTIIDGELLSDYVYTDENGFANLPITYSDDNDDLILTITKKDFFTIIDTIHINDNDNINFVSIDPIDEFVAGQESQFNISLKNYGSSSVNNVTAQISTADERISIIDSEEIYAEIGSNSTAISESPFSFTATGNFSDGEIVTFALEISEDENTYNSLFDIEINSSNIDITEILSDNEALPGEQYDFNLELQNSGSQNLTSATLTLLVPNTVELISEPFTNQNILTDETIQLSDASVIFNEHIVNGQQIDLELSIEAENGYSQIIPFSITVGTVSISDPTGPDNYGYFIYDDEDTSYSQSTLFNWLEIDPNHGGSGISFDMIDEDTSGNGDMKTIELPFSFRFYGKLYSMISVSSNGYIVPGQKYVFDWMNWPLPGPFLPSPLIAPFWDDLLTSADGTGNVYYYYDEEQHAMIIQWSRMMNRFSYSEETFQAVIYDSNVYNTNLGDSVIKFNYLVINNDDQGVYQSYLIEHGEFATVGIANTDGSDGIEYSYSSEYPVSAKQLENNMALTISGPTQPLFTPFLILNSLNFEETSGNMNDILDAGESFNLAVTVTNLGITEAENVACTISCDDQYITILNNNILIGNIGYDEDILANDQLSFSISGDCPNQYIAHLNMNFEGDNVSQSEEYEITINAKEMNFESYEIFNEDSSIIGINDTGEMQVTIQKTSYLTIDNLTVSLEIQDPSITITPSEFSLENVEDEFTEMVFTISTSTETPVGESIPFEINYNYDTIEQTFGDVIMFGDPLIIFSDDFEEGNLNTNWTSSNAILGSENYAGGEGLEAVISDNFGDFGYLLCHPITLLDARKVIIKFNARNFDGFSNYGVIAYGNNSTTEFSETLMSENTVMDSAQNFILEHNFDEPYSGAYNFYFYRQTASNYDQTFAIDDVEVYSLTGATGTVSGNFSFDENPADFEEIEFSFSGMNVDVQQDGSYFAILPAGDYTISAEMDGYFMDEYSVEIEGNQEIELDLQMEYLEKPINLTYEIENNSVFLNWEYEDDTARKTKSRQPDLSQFKIYMTIGDYGTYTIMNEDLDYSRPLYINSDYSFYITAIYDDFESLPSNEVNFNFVGNSNETQIPTVFALKQNFPNPFNPKTSIGFDIVKDRHIEIGIYNVKGQLIKNLTNEMYSAGSHQLIWNGNDNTNNQASSGVYFYKISVDGKPKDLKKCILLK